MIDRYRIAACLCFITAHLSAQEFPMQTLEEVVVSDTRVKRYAEGHKVAELRDSTITRNAPFLTSLLAFNSNIYFRENGLGMVSSPSFRGTNASHTAVIWNGININSQLNGQVDFNTVNPFNYSSIDIRSGGGSVQFGTGAIGGTVHLNNDLKFEEHFDHQVIAGYGSFETASLNYNHSLGTGRWSSSLGINYNHSDNDYRYLETGERNENGEFDLLNINFNAGYILSDTQVIRLYHQSFIGDRNLSGTLVAPGRSRYEDTQHRTQAEWNRFGNKVAHKVKVAHLYEGYRYFENKDTDLFSEGRVTTLLARYAIDVELSKAFRLNSFAEYNHFAGTGSNLGSPERSDLALTAVLKHTVSGSFRYNFSLRQDVSTDFTSPLVFAWNGSFDVTSWYSLQLNGSRNFRAPTFNDLYWQPGGNPDLLPESSYQVDLGQRFVLGPASLNLNAFYIATTDMIRWLPDTRGIWSPLNVDEVRIYGAEAELRVKKPLLENHALELSVNYGYTVSQDADTGQQLIYVPFHRGNAAVAYSVGPVSLFYQHLYNGPVSIIGGELDGYQVGNTGLTYTLASRGAVTYRLGIMLNNAFNTYYENIALRPMPNRNIQSQFLLTF